MVRKVLWQCRTYPELARTHCYVPARILKTFEASRVSLRVLLLQVYFIERLVGSRYISLSLSRSLSLLIY